MNVILCCVFDLVVVLFSAAWADPDKPGGAAGPNAAGAARNAAVRNRIVNLRDMKFLPGIDPV